MFKLIFYLINTIFTIFYLYPGSIFGFLLYRNFNKQPQLTDDFNFFLLNFSSNHVYAFLVLSFLGLLSYYKNKAKILFIYLFFISIFLEICHIFIPHRSFQYQDIFGNFLGVFIIFIFFILYQLLKSNK